LSAVTARAFFAKVNARLQKKCGKPKTPRQVPIRRTWNVCAGAFDFVALFGGVPVLAGNAVGHRLLERHFIVTSAAHIALAGR
jgi:hypothetical protein